MLRSFVYKDGSFIGEAQIRPQNNKIGVWGQEIRISHFSKPSDRCPPLAVLSTIAADGFCFKMDTPPPPPPPDESPLFAIYAACLREKKTAVVPLGSDELHLVAMPSRISPLQYVCFWGFTVASGLYNPCLEMLNRRCLGIVFDLDETLVVANTMRSFEDRINNLLQKISSEGDQQRLGALFAEVKRYQEDKSVLKQFIENDQVVENGNVFNIQNEVIAPLSEGHHQINRPVIRLPGKNIILTRVNPAIRDTSVLVRVRPQWEDLRSYLTARGRKRFEVYVCTMAERDYALEIWRLLDPESKLINSDDLLSRIVCVKSELKKSLPSVFQDGQCHPKMALVVDDRLTVWDTKDKARVHVVPAFAPYFAPQAEAGGSVAVLCVARNVACNVRGGFFKEYDECLLPRISSACYEDELRDLPSAPDVSNYLISEEDTSTTNGNKDPLRLEGMADVEVEGRFKETNCNIQAVPPVVNNFNHMQLPSVHHVMQPPFGVTSMPVPQVIMPFSNNHFPSPIVSFNPVGQLSVSEHSLQGSPAREEGEVNESELDPDTRRRLLILQHGQDIRGPLPFQLGPPSEVPLPAGPSVSGQSPQRWLPEEDKAKRRQLNETSRECLSYPETAHFVENRSHPPSFFCNEEDSNPSGRGNHKNKRLSAEVYHGTEKLRRNRLRSSSLTGNAMSWRPISTRNRDEHVDSCQVIGNFFKTPVEVLQGIATESGAKVEYRTGLVNITELQFSVEAWFVGEKIGEGIGGTRKEAQRIAAKSAIQNLANQYLIDFPEATTFRDQKASRTRQMDIMSNSNLHGCSTFFRNDLRPNGSEYSQFPDRELEGIVKPSDSVASLKELCTLKGFGIAFNAEISPSAIADDEHMRRSLQTDPDRSWKTDFSQVSQRLPSFGRLSKDEVPQS